MKSRSVSIQDIARAAGVSHTTVSRALRDSPLISVEVRARIQRLAGQMGYTPNALARSLKRQRTNTVGLIVTSIADPFYGRVARGVDDGARQGSVDVFLGVSYNSAEEEMAVIESFQRRRVDGIITVSSRLCPEHLDRLERLGTPVVVVNRQAEGHLPTLASVQVDSYGGARLAVEHLLALGHTAIAYLGATNRPASNAQRMAGYCDALNAAGLEVQEGWIQQALPESRSYSDDVADSQKLMFNALRAGVTAAFCYNDMFAVGALLVCRQLEIAVPDQFSIVGFDDVELAQYVTPPLTTVHQPKLRLGQLAVEMLLKLMQNEPVENLIVPVHLVVRSSSGPLSPVARRLLADTRLSTHLAY